MELIDAGNCTRLKLPIALAVWHAGSAAVKSSRSSGRVSTGANTITPRRPADLVSNPLAKQAVQGEKASESDRLN